MASSASIKAKNEASAKRTQDKKSSSGSSSSTFSSTPLSGQAGIENAKKISAAASETLGKLKAITSDSSSTRADRSATDNDIKNFESKVSTRSLERAAEAERAQIEAERQALDARRDAEVANIESSFGDLKIGTEEDQAREYAGRATELVTSGGGFLGATQSQSGALQKLRTDQRNELSALETKKQSAIQAARNAYDDRDFALARDLVKSAREVEQEIYKRQQSYSDRQIDLLKYANEEDRLAKKPVQDLASKYLSAGIDPEIDDFETASAKIRNSREYQLDVQKTEAEIAKLKADKGLPPTNFVDVMQAAIDEGASPEEAARAAALISEQTGIQVDQKTLNDWTAQARRLTKRIVTQVPVSTTTPSPSFSNPLAGSGSRTTVTPSTGTNNRFSLPIPTNIDITKFKAVEDAFFTNLFSQ